MEFFNKIEGVNQGLWQVCERYLHINQQVYQVKKIVTQSISLELSKNSKSNMLFTILKIASYLTVILPLLSICVKLHYRSKYDFIIEKKKSATSTLKSLRQQPEQKSPLSKNLPTPNIQKPIQHSSLNSNQKGIPIQDYRPSYEILLDACEKGDLKMAKMALDRFAYVNTNIKTGTSPLLIACKKGHSKLVLFLLEKGATVKFIGGTHDHETPLSEARFHGSKMQECISLLEEKDNGFTDEFLQKKLIGHKFSLKGASSVAGQEFQLEGFRPRYTVTDYLTTSKPYYEDLKKELREGKGPLLDLLGNEYKQQLQNPGIRQQMITAIDVMRTAVEDALLYDKKTVDESVNKEPNEMLADIQNGKPLVLFGVTSVKETWVNGAPNLHAWGVVVVKKPNANSYIVNLCNRGYGSKIHGVQAWELDQDKTLELIKTYQSHTNWKANNLYDTTTQFFQRMNINESNVPNKFLKQKSQSVGNCCYYSIQSIEFALLTRLFEPIFGNITGKNLAKAIRTQRSKTTKLKILKDYAENPLADKNLIKRLVGKLTLSLRYREIVQVLSKSL